MVSILPDKFVLDPIYIAPPRLRDGTDRPDSQYSYLLNYELLLVLNGKSVAYTLNFTVPSNLAIESYRADGSTIPYSATDIANMNDIFALAELNDLYFIRASKNPDWAIYFKLENLNKALLLDYFLRSYKPDTLLSQYIVFRLHGYELRDIEATLFSYRNGQNIVALRAQNARNFAYIVAKGDQLIQDLEISCRYLKYLRSVTFDTTDSENPCDVVVQKVPLWTLSYTS